MKNRAPIISIAIISLIALVNACDHTERESSTTPGPTPTASPSVTPKAGNSPPPAATSSGTPPWLVDGATHSVASVLDSPKTFIGRTVTVVAEIDEVNDSRAFELEAEHTRKTLLVVVPKVGDFPVIDEQWEDSRARVTGVIQWLEPKNVEREVGWALPLSLETKFKGAPVLIARSVERLPE